MKMPIVGGMVNANISDCISVCKLEGNFDFFKFTDIIVRVDGKVIGRQE
jgi:hypothetical protein